ncbi:hypothetical protein DOS70_01585 [Staphylococcus felis]|uniref:hypothetical protein n=1 Tax=Staphylococcus felis TaxID=46127 RepID=UPI000E2447EE|nr:hypothetical protein [Staphylococcus felis]REH97594.1 hypothetical protein DOS70_01585 [Staphylococcus felis]REI29281.1 hypothetical protein DOS81_07140 [Staphylococcus felis]
MQNEKLINELRNNVLSDTEISHPAGNSEVVIDLISDDYNVQAEISPTLTSTLTVDLASATIVTLT